MKPQHQRWLLVLLLVAAYVWMACRFMPFPANFEDSYIMYRYVQNGADGFLYEWNRNAGTVQGMTGIAWVTLLTLFTRISSFNVIDVNSYAGLFFSILTLICVYATATRYLHARQRWLAICPLIVIGSSAFFVRSSGNGLETSITIFLVAVSIWMLEYAKPASRMPFLLGLFTGLTVLVRPDLPLFPLSLFFFSFALSDAPVSQRVKDCLALISCTLIAAVITLFFVRLLTDTALPLATGVKLALADLLLGRLPESQYRFILSSQLGFLSHMLPLVLLALLALCFLERRESIRYVPIYLACVVYYAYQFSVLPIVNVAHRFQLPLLIGMSFAIVHFFDYASQHSANLRRGSVLTVGITLILALGNVSGLYSGKREAEAYIVDHNAYEVIGKEVRGIDGVVIASPEAGKLAYFSQQKFFDTIGLNDRFVSQNHKLPDYPARLLDYLKTDFGMPDIYVRPAHPQIETYSYLEILPGFKSMYACNTPANSEEIGLTVCVDERSPRAAAVHAALVRTGLGIEFH